MIIPEWVERLPPHKRQLWIWQSEYLEILKSLVWFPSEVFNEETIRQWVELRNVPMDQINRVCIDRAVELRNGLQSRLADSLF